MKILLTTQNAKLTAELQRAFGKFENLVYVECADDFSHKADAIVCGGNSFGFLPKNFVEYFGDALQVNLQSEIKKLPMREVLVGQTLTLKTDNLKIPNLIYSPTMRTSLDISASANVYLAFKASLLKAIADSHKTVICPAFGLDGGMEPGDCARQMYRAYHDVFDKYPKFPGSLRETLVNYTELVGMINMKKGRR